MLQLFRLVRTRSDNHDTWVIWRAKDLFFHVIEQWSLPNLQWQEGYRGRSDLRPQEEYMFCAIDIYYTGDSDKSGFCSFR